jgi:antitoxin component of RelBE/YafQ-DinJ toxin-antitoxin module
MTEKELVSYRLKPEVKAKIVELSEELGISQTAVIHMAVRCLEKQSSLKRKQPPPREEPDQ